ncbi:MAG: hypothetical protein ACLP2F_04795 [Steroidobacteraceae bacterium]
MTNEHKSAQSPDEKFNFGVQELKQARAAQTQTAGGLTVDSASRKAANETRGFDPYNTSGSFDRKKHWERVRKR